MGLPPPDDESSPCANRSASATESFSGKSGGDRRSGKRKSVTSAKALANDSIFAIIALSDRFEKTTISVIVLNALWIGGDTEWNHKSLIGDDGKPPLEPGSVVVENLFCVYFTLEVVIRFLAYKRKITVFRDAWFVFDSMLVTCMIIETWLLVLIEAIQGGDSGASFLSNFSALRLLRLLRLTRMARLMRSVPELMTLVKGMVSAAKSTFFILLFLVLVMYVFAIIFTSQMGDPANSEPEPETAEHMFGTMGDSMMSLFTHGVLGDNLSATLQAILDFPNGEGSDAGVCLLWLFLVFFAISSMTLLNMLIGVLCEVITQTASDEKEAYQIGELRMCMEDAFSFIDVNEDGRVTETEWSQIKDTPGVRAQLGCLGVEASHMDERLDQMQATLFRGRRKLSSEQNFEPEGLSLEDLISKVIDLRPDKPASALDVELLAAKVQLRDQTFKKRLSRVEDILAGMLAKKGAPIAGTTQVSAMEAGSATGSNLSKIPTQLLFQEVKSRAQKTNPGRGGCLLPNQGAVSYSAIKNLCNDLGN